MNTCVCGNPASGNGTKCLRCCALDELGLKSGATDPEIRSAYYLYVKAWHPDQLPGDDKSKSAAQKKLKAINFAYSYLEYLSANSQGYDSKPASAPTNTQAPAHRGPRASQQPSSKANGPTQQPFSKSDGGGSTSPRSTRPTTLISRFSVPRRWGYLLYLLPFILWTVGEFVTRLPHRGLSSGTSTEAPSLAVPRQNNAVLDANPPSSHLTQVPLDRNYVVPTPAVRLLNGTELGKRRHLNGLGALTVENGTSFDAVVHLVDLKNEKAIRTFYVQQGGTFTERQIAPGLYGIYFATGNSWNPELKNFSSAASYSHFGRNLEYSEKRGSEAGNVGYATYTITLHPVLGGNVVTYSSDKGTFDKMMNNETTE